MNTSPLDTSPMPEPRDPATEPGSTIFADPARPRANQELVKARLTIEIIRIIKHRGLTQHEAAKVLGIQQPRVSALLRDRAGSFSIGRLFDFLTVLGSDVEIKVTPGTRERGAVSITFP